MPIRDYMAERQYRARTPSLTSEDYEYAPSRLKAIEEPGAFSRIGSALWDIAATPISYLGTALDTLARPVRTVLHTRDLGRAAESIFRPSAAASTEDLLRDVGYETQVAGEGRSWGRAFQDFGANLAVGALTDPSMLLGVGLLSKGGNAVKAATRQSLARLGKETGEDALRLAAREVVDTGAAHGIRLSEAQAIKRLRGLDTITERLATGEQSLLSLGVPRIPFTPLAHNQAQLGLYSGYGLATAINKAADVAGAYKAGSPIVKWGEKAARYFMGGSGQSSLDFLLHVGNAAGEHAVAARRAMVGESFAKLRKLGLDDQAMELVGEAAELTANVGARQKWLKITGQPIESMPVRSRVFEDAWQELSALPAMQNKATREAVEATLATVSDTMAWAGKANKEAGRGTGLIGGRVLGQLRATRKDLVRLIASYGGPKLKSGENVLEAIETARAAGAKWLDMPMLNQLTEEYELVSRLSATIPSYMMLSKSDDGIEAMLKLVKEDPSKARTMVNKFGELATGREANKLIQKFGTSATGGRAVQGKITNAEFVKAFRKGGSEEVRALVKKKGGFFKADPEARISGYLDYTAKSVGERQFRQGVAHLFGEDLPPAIMEAIKRKGFALDRAKTKGIHKQMVKSLRQLLKDHADAGATEEKLNDVIQEFMNRGPLNVGEDAAGAISRAEEIAASLGRASEYSREAKLAADQAAQAQEFIGGMREARIGAATVGRAIRAEWREEVKGVRATEAVLREEAKAAYVQTKFSRKVANDAELARYRAEEQALQDIQRARMEQAGKADFVSEGQFADAPPPALPDALRPPLLAPKPQKPSIKLQRPPKPEVPYALGYENDAAFKAAARRAMASKELAQVWYSAARKGVGLAGKEAKAAEDALYAFVSEHLDASARAASRAIDDVPLHQKYPEMFNRVALDKLPGFQDKIYANKMISGEVAEQVVESRRHLRDGRTYGVIAKPFMEFTRAWKVATLTNPGTWIRNKIGNLFLRMSGGGIDHLSLFEEHALQQVAAAMRLPSKRGLPMLDSIQFTIGQGKTISAYDLVDKMDEWGFLDSGLWGKEFRGSGKGVLNKAIEYAGVVPSVLENADKIGFVTARLRAGDTFAEAGYKANKYLFDYNRTSPFVDNMRKLGVAPFLAWSSKNIPLQLELLMTRPGQFAALLHAKRAIEAGVPGVKDEELPAWARDKFGVAFKRDDDGSVHFVLGENVIPAADLPRVADVGEFISESFGPMARIPIQWLANRDLFNKKTIEEIDGQYDLLKVPFTEGVPVRGMVAMALRAAIPKAHSFEQAAELISGERTPYYDPASPKKKSAYAVTGLWNPLTERVSKPDENKKQELSAIDRDIRDAKYQVKRAKGSRLEPYATQALLDLQRRRLQVASRKAVIP